MSQHDSNFYKPFIWVLGALVVFTFLIAILANMFSPLTDRSSDPLVLEGQKKQIAPVGQSRVEPASEVAATEETKEEVVAEVETAVSTKTEAATAEAEEPAAEPAPEIVEVKTEDPVVKNTTAAAAVTASTAAVAATAAIAVSETANVTDATESALGAEIPLKVRAVVATNCAGCHQEGVKGAQRTDDAAAWSGLASKGLDALTASVINGKGEMMPRAETSLSDDELGLAVQHMIAKAVGEGAGAGPAVAEGKTDTDAEAATPAAESTAEVEKPAETAAESATANVTETTTVTAVAATTAATTAAATTEVATAMPANVKTVVDTLCAGCHISGVANAPKFGDKAVWDQRMAMGIDKLLASAIAGKGAMPARGGSQLSDAELQLAIEYMASK